LFDIFAKTVAASFSLGHNRRFRPESSITLQLDGIVRVVEVWNPSSNVFVKNWQINRIPIEIIRNPNIFKII
jgi:hypothetical protein